MNLDEIIAKNTEIYRAGMEAGREQKERDDRVYAAAMKMELAQWVDEVTRVKNALRSLLYALEQQHPAETWDWKLEAAVKAATEVLES